MNRVVSELDISGITLESSSINRLEAEEVIEEEKKTVKLIHLNKVGSRIPQLAYHTNCFVTIRQRVTLLII